MDNREMADSWWHDRDHYPMLMKALVDHSAVGWMKAVAGAAGAVLSVVLVFAALSSAGPTNTVDRTLVIVGAAAAALWALRWWALPLPTATQSLALFAVADVAITAVCVQGDYFLGRSAGIILLLAIGLYFMIFHTARALVAHAFWTVATVLMLWLPLLKGDTAVAAFATIAAAVSINIGALPALHFGLWLVWEDKLSDALTGLLSRRGLEFRAPHVIEQDSPSTLCAIVIDLDRFKSINDKFGHHVGDTVLAHTAGLLRTIAPPSALVARTGGEEFAILTRVPMTAACATAARLRDAIAQPTGPAPVTASIGVAVLDTDNAGHDPADESVTDLLHRADTAMYRAKQQGGNAVVLDDRTATPAAEIAPPNPNHHLL